MMDEILIILILILLNGLFAMSEIAIVSSRKSRLDELLRKGRKKAKLVIALSENPNRFLSTVQVGITLISILIGVFGGRDFALMLATKLGWLGFSPVTTERIALAIVVVIITFFSITIGELLPKRIGLTNPERISMAVAQPMMFLSKLTAPFVWLLSVSTDFLVKLLDIRKRTESQVTEEEIRALIEEGTEGGAIQEIEQDIVERVFHLGDQRIGALMTTRGNIVWLDSLDTNEQNLQIIKDNTHSVYPLCEEELDNILGIIYAKDLLIAMLVDPDLDLKKYIKPVNYVPSDQKAYEVLERFKASKIHYAFVVDEFGSIEGMVTINDILDGLVGDITDTDEPEIVEREDGTWLIDGQLAFFEFIHEFEIENYDYSQDQFHSMGGFAIHELKSIPKAGDRFDWNGFRFEIIDMDGNRVDKILLTKLPEAE